MGRKSFQASITVFLSLVCILFLALICAATESARMQGAKAQSAAVTGMATFSLMSEFEPALLKKYELFALDGGRSGSFQSQAVNEKLKTYLSTNANPKDGLLKSFHFDPWNLKLQESSVCGYALLTDDNGEAFYQQAVSYMKQNLPFFAIDELFKLADNEDLFRKEEAYESARKNSDSQMQQIEVQEEEMLQQIEEGEETGNLSVTVQESVENPIPILKALRKGVILTIVAGDKPISEKSIRKKELPSGRSLQKGTMELEKEHSGILSNLLFREYLVQHFPNYTGKKTGAALDYQLEYIICGKNGDQENMRKMAFDLMMLRSGIDFFCCNLDGTMRSEALALATSLTAWIPIPAVAVAAQRALQEGILLAWAFGESLIDLRCLLNGGKVPIRKTRDNWQLKLSNLAQISELLRSDVNSDNENGLTYTDHLRILLFCGMGNLKDQKMRALDLIQAQMRKEKGMGSFQVDHCIVAVQTSATFQCSPVFLGLPQVVMGLTGGGQTFTQTASLAY